MNRPLSRLPRVTAGLAAAVCAVAVLAGAAQTAPAGGAIDRATLLRDLEVLSSDAMQGREVGTPGGAKARAYLVGRFREAGLQPFGATYEQPFSFRMAGRNGDAAVRHGVNVVGQIRGRRPPGRYLVVSAHYDHVGIKEGEVFNGADDNASGTAALLALATYFRTHQPDHSLIFAAFDGEEAGLRGSRAFVAKPPVSRSAIALNVNIDMVGRDPARRLFAAGAFPNPSLRPYLEDVAAGAPVALLLGHDRPGQPNLEDWMRDSDQWAFQEAGIPGLYLGVEDYAQHHKATDDFETIDADFFVGATRTALAIVRVFDAALDAIVGQ